MKPKNDSGEINTLENEKSEQNNERSLISVLGVYLKSNGIAISDGAIRDLPETSYKQFDVVQAVNALKLLKFDASFGKLKFRRIFKLKLASLICFDHSGTAFLLDQGAGKDSFTLTKHEYGEIVSLKITRAELKEIFNGYAIIAIRKLGESTEKRDKNWFFGSLAKGKFLYLSIKDKLHKNKSYNISLGQCIKDINEGNILDTLSYIYNDNNLEHTELSGVLKDSYTLEYLENCWIMLFDEKIEDSLLIKSTPKYISKTDKIGRFYFPNLIKKNYKILALSGFDFIFNTDEKIAFLNRKINTVKDTFISLLAFKENIENETIDSNLYIKTFTVDD